jgi:hypothetical protein
VEPTYPDRCVQLLSFPLEKSSEKIVWAGTEVELRIKKTANTAAFTRRNILFINENLLKPVADWFLS